MGGGFQRGDLGHNQGERPKAGVIFSVFRHADSARFVLASSALDAP